MKNKTFYEKDFIYIFGTLKYFSIYSVWRHLLFPVRWRCPPIIVTVTSIEAGRKIPLRAARRRKEKGSFFGLRIAETKGG